MAFRSGLGVFPNIAGECAPEGAGVRRLSGIGNGEEARVYLCGGGAGGGVVPFWGPYGFGEAARRYWFIDGAGDGALEW